MKYSPLDIYKISGKDDKVSVLSFRKDSESYNEYGESVTVLFLYTQDEREEFDRHIYTESASNNGAEFIKVKYLVGKLTAVQQANLDQKGIKIEDINNIFSPKTPSTNTFHSTEQRTITTLEIPVCMMSKGRDFDWIYGFHKQLIKEGVGFCPAEKNFFLAAKLYYEPDEITKAESDYMYENGKVKKEIQWEYLNLKAQRQEISEDEKLQASKLFLERTLHNIQVLNKHLKQAGTSLKKLTKENKVVADNLLDKALQFRERRLNVIGKTPIYLDIDRYFHIYTRHVKEMKTTKHFNGKSNLQWQESDVMVVMEKVIDEANEEIQNFFDQHPGQRYSRYGKDCVYFEGDYYIFHVEPTGRISTFHRNWKLQEGKV